MAQYSEKHQGSPEHTRRPWLPTPIYSRIRKYRLTIDKPAKERRILPMDQRVHTSARMAKRHSNIGTSPRSP
jgi:hypothetical protein